MKLSLRSAVFALLLQIPLADTYASEFYVSPTGNDSGTGSKDQPFATLHKAQQSARMESAKGQPVTVYLRSGTHYLSKPLTLTPADSGTKDAPVVYRAFEKETPVVSGGMKLKLQWEAFRDGIQQAKVPEDFNTDQLFVYGQRQPMARYPNFNAEERVYNGYAPDAISPERVKRWADPTGGYIHAMHAAEWGGYHFLITGKKDAGTLKYEGGWQNNRPSGMHGRFRFVENIFEELDAPGEWFHDRKAQKLYYFPAKGVDLTTADIEGVKLRHLIEVQGSADKPVHHVQIHGITFRHAARTFMDNKEPLVRSDWTTYRGGALFFTGSEDCSVEDCFVDQVGGNAIFANEYNRRLTVRGCHIAQAGGNGVAFVGDRNAARVPRDWKDNSQSYDKLDRTVGPKTNNYPADCIVDDCLIHSTGRVEKQTSPVQIELAQSITVRHCSLYDVPRAGINIGDGCWGGHLIEFCDIFDTVKETGDHGSFNSWGRDRFWNLRGLNLDDDKTWAKERDLPVLDAVKTTIMRNNRWRCDHGWDIDLDDGSTNYHIYNNLCLRGGLKNREGFFRVIENNIIINNGFHPHVWYKHSEDIVRRNIMTTDHYLPAGGMPSTAWGKEMDYNLVHQAGVKTPRPAVKLAKESKRDEHSIVADALFVDASKGDFRVKPDSPALKLGFVNFPMNEFGVQKPSLKAIARTPELPKFEAVATGPAQPQGVHLWQGLKIKDLEGEEYSAFGVAKDSGGVQILSGTYTGLEVGDLIQSVNGKPVKVYTDMYRLQNDAAGKPLELGIFRKQKATTVTVSDYLYFKTGSDTPTADAAPIAAITTKPATNNDPVAMLYDGKLAEGYGPVFGNGVKGGSYKVDLGKSIKIGEIKTWSYHLSKNRGHQRLTIYGSNSETDPGWNLSKYKPMIEVDTAGIAIDQYLRTSIHASKDRDIGTYRWLMWVTEPVTEIGENTAFQEFQIILKK